MKPCLPTSLLNSEQRLQDMLDSHRLIIQTYLPRLSGEPVEIKNYYQFVMFMGKPGITFTRLAACTQMGHP